jgi:Fic family protein
MKSLLQLSSKPAVIPAQAAWYLADLAEAIGRQKMYTQQNPEKLRVLRDFALIESAVSSNRIEGVMVDDSRVGTLMFGSPHFQDRDEEEVCGYRDALNLVHGQGARLPVTGETVKRLHHLCRGTIWDAGQYKEKDVDIIQTYPDGRSRVRFRTTPAVETTEAMGQLTGLWERGLQERWVHPLILAAALNLDFLCIHPFRDGNGRVSRLLFLLATYHCGMEAGRYISIERIIEQNKERYYEVLEQSSVGWHEGTHDPWPAINFLLYVLVAANKEFEGKVGQLGSPRGVKTAAVRAAVERQTSAFRVADIREACPGVGIDLIRRVLSDMRKEGVIKAHGTGRSAQWDKTTYS